MHSNLRLSLSADILRALYSARSDSSFNLDALCTAVGVLDAPAREGVRVRAARREDVREIVSALDTEGFVDAARMKLTLQGFALASSLTTRRLVPLHLVA